MAPSRPTRREKAIEQLAQYLNLSPEAIDIAEGWSILPEGTRRHLKLVIDDHIASLHPLLRELYGNASHQDQLRFNRIITRIQGEKRGQPPEI